MEITEFGKKIEEGIVLTIGYFDSLHIGHEALINKVKEESKKLGSKSAALIFVGMFKMGKDVYSLGERLEKIKKYDLDYVIIATVDRFFMQMTKDEFIDNLRYLYNLKGVVAGYDFRFGRGAEGDSEYLQSKLSEYIVPVTIVGEVRYKDKKISSSYIKELLENGDVETAGILLGEHYVISGKVVKGKEIGRTIGFPTANIFPSFEKVELKEGVYLTNVKIGNKFYKGITNVGPQPTVNGGTYICETHIVDFDGDLYDSFINVYFIKKIRDIIKFESLDELKDQLKKDISFVKKEI